MEVAYWSIADASPCPPGLFFWVVVPSRRMKAHFLRIRPCPLSKALMKVLNKLRGFKRNQSFFLTIFESGGGRYDVRTLVTRDTSTLLSFLLSLPVFICAVPSRPLFLVGLYRRHERSWICTWLLIGSMTVCEPLILSFSCKVTRSFRGCFTKN